MNYREHINKLIRQKDLEQLLYKSAEFHGHICSFSAYGVKAACYAMNQLNLEHEGMEEVLAIVETNNCFSDGVQLVTGCTFGNNALIFYDLGKTAVTVASRANKQWIRLVLKASFWKSRAEIYPRLFELYENIVTKRKNVGPQVKKEFRQLGQNMASSELKVPEPEMFVITKGKAEPPRFAPIHKSVICSQCGESVMETRARLKEGQPYCLACAADRFFYMDGYGIGCREQV
ncbi:MAG: FmdE family protein [Actinomycetota bacterium]|nr:FmdE family protein [Actinomycetota bacterium]